jgi:hypothetical protein
LAELVRLAQGHEQAGRLNEAEEALARALALAPEQPVRSICSASSAFSRVESRKRRR